MAIHRNHGQVLFSVFFKKGAANKNRLPLLHVVEALKEIELTIREVGQQIQREAGVENPDGDFGIEILAGKAGFAIHKGSLGMQLPITRHIDHGMQAAIVFIETANIVEKNRPVPVSEHNERVLRRLPNIGRLQERDKTELHLTLSHHGQVLKRAKLGERGLEVLRGMEVAELEVVGITLYGKLRELRDRTRGGEEREYFWGELLEDGGRKWRIRFNDSALEGVLPLFGKPVVIVGNATYFKTATPRVDAHDIHEDEAIDYVAAFDEFSEKYEDVFRDRDPQDVLKDIR